MNPLFNDLTDEQVTAIKNEIFNEFDNLFEDENVVQFDDAR
mgnify:CR=1 FL=1|tara:strand:+ start:777 stop:899 length:123 start_codon:yes stop_codon:yes gene_type:complete